MDKGISRRKWLELALFGGGGGSLLLALRGLRFGRDETVPQPKTPTATPGSLQNPELSTPWHLDLDSCSNPIREAQDHGKQLTQHDIYGTFSALAKRFDADEKHQPDTKQMVFEKLSFFNENRSPLFVCSYPVNPEDTATAIQTALQISEKKPSMLYYSNTSTPQLIHLEASPELPQEPPPVPSSSGKDARFVDDPLPYLTAERNRDLSFLLDPQGGIIQCVITTTYHLEQYVVTSTKIIDREGTENTKISIDGDVHATAEPLFQNLEKAWKSRKSTGSHPL